MTKINLKALDRDIFIQGNDSVARTIQIGQTVTVDDVVVIDSATWGVTAGGVANFDGNVTLTGGCTSPSTGAGSNNEAYGDGALGSLNGGGQNFAGGKSALGNVTTGSNHVGIGSSAGAGLVAGDSCMCIGANTVANADVSEVTAVGVDACRQLAAGTPNGVGIGFRAGKGDNTSKGSGVNFVAVGNTVGQVFTTANNWVGVGDGVLVSLTTGSGHTIIGSQAGGAITTGTNDTLIGQQAGDLLTGSGCVFIGRQAGATLTAVDNTLIIHNSNSATPLIYGEFDNFLVGIKQETPLSRLHLTVESSDAVDCLNLEQLDVSENFVAFQATSGASVTNPLTSYTTGNTIQGFARVDINGTARWMPFYDNPTS
jgi:hypothetical protein